MNPPLRSSCFLFAAWVFFANFTPCTARAESVWWHAEQTFLGAFDSTGLTILAVGTVATFVAANNDVATQQAWTNNQHMPGNFSAIGDYWGQGYVAYPVILGQLIWDTQNGIVSLEGMAESAVVVTGLKYSVRRERPDQSDDLSFPSGHSQTSFSFAASMGVEYPLYVSVPAYAMAVYTGLSRLADNKHWLSDVVAGATIGTMFGRAGYKHHFKLTPMAINDGGDGFGLVATWKF